jgi:hypothetical protein
VAILDGRLDERATVDWALRLNPTDAIIRLALLDLIDSPAGQKIEEPWRSAWRLIEVSWNNPAVYEHASTGAYHARRRLRAGDRSRSLVNAIVDLVAPRLKVEALSELYRQAPKPRGRPKTVGDLLSVRMTSREIVDPGVLELGEIADRSFLMSLALALDAAVVDGLDLARQIGWDGERDMWTLGLLYRVYYVPQGERADGTNEPDEFHQGIAPSVKLLHTVVSRLVEIHISSAVEFVNQWKLRNSPVHLRLWAALSRDSRVTPANEVGDFLLSLDDPQFWDVNAYPEVAELRAKRFGELERHEQEALTARIRKRPPRNQWPRKADADRVAGARLLWALRELRRIEVAGHFLPQRDKAWLDERIDRFPDLVPMARTDEGFLASVEARWVPPNPDSRYDSIAGEARLKALETALSSARRGWDDDPAKRAEDWIGQQGSRDKIFADLEATPDGGAAFPRVWRRLGWTHPPAKEQSGDTAQRDLRAESARVLSLLAKLPEATLRQAIDGISHWLSAWAKQIVGMPEALTVWLKLWPIAVEVTNARQSAEKESHLSTVLKTSDDSEPMALDTLNTPAGKLVGAFLHARPGISGNDRPFESDDALRMMRDLVITANGPSGLIARHRMIEHLPWFLRADKDWTNEHLITPLLADDSEALALWRAIARQTHFTDVLKIIGAPMAERAADPRLGRETRRSLVFTLVVECLHAFREQRAPAVPYPRIQQTIRLLDDEVRAYGAEAIPRFVRELSGSPGEEQLPSSVEELFRSAAKPFLQQVWPQERSLATPGVSKALADLPAAAGEAFAEALDTIERFLVPFECWSLLDYGLYGEENGRPKLSTIDSDEKAAALLQLLDLTIGTAEGSVIPDDLADALDRLRQVAPDLAASPRFRRLATAARRA